MASYPKRKMIPMCSLRSKGHLKLVTIYLQVNIPIFAPCVPDILNYIDFLKSIKLSVAYVCLFLPLAALAKLSNLHSSFKIQLECLSLYAYIPVVEMVILSLVLSECYSLFHVEAYSLH